MTDALPPNANPEKPLTPAARRALEEAAERRAAEAAALASIAQRAGRQNP